MKTGFASYHLAGRMMKSRRRERKRERATAREESRGRGGIFQWGFWGILSEDVSWLYSQLRAPFSVYFSFTEAFTAVAKGGRAAGRRQ